MSCAGCVKHVAAVLEALPGVEANQVEVGAAVVTWHAGRSTAETISGALAEAGYEAAKESPNDTR